MQKILKYRPLTIFAAIIFGITLIGNLIQLNTELNNELVFYPYLIMMIAALALGTVGYVIVNPKLIRMSTGVWILSAIYNFAAIVFIIPIILLNIFGSRKMSSKLELDSEEKDE